MSKISTADYITMQARLEHGRRKAGFIEECAGEQYEGPESDLHELIITDLRAHRAYIVHSRMDIPTTQQKGVCDIIAAMPDGKTLWLEIKRKGGKLTPEQAATRHALLALGHQHSVIYSMRDYYIAMGIN